MGQGLQPLLERGHRTGRQIAAGRQCGLERRQQHMQSEIGFWLREAKRGGMRGW